MRLAWRGRCLVLLVAAVAYACRPTGPPPSNEAVVAAIRKNPPAPPTLGPTVMASVERVTIRQRGDYNRDGRYWPVRAHIEGKAQRPRTLTFTTGLPPPSPIEFQQEVRVRKDDFGAWVVDYVGEPAWAQKGPYARRPSS